MPTKPRGNERVRALCITLDPAVVRQLDAFAQQHGLKRSAALNRVLTHFFGDRRLAVRVTVTDDGWPFGEPPVFTATTADQLEAAD